MARQHRRQIRALSHYACSSCIARQASGFGAGLSCCAGSGGARWRPLPSPSPAPLKGPTRTTAVAALERRQPGWADGSVNGSREGGRVRAFAVALCRECHGKPVQHVNTGARSEPCRTTHALHAYAQLDRPRHSGRDCRAMQVLDGGDGARQRHRTERESHTTGARMRAPKPVLRPERPPPPAAGATSPAARRER